MRLVSGVLRSAVRNRLIPFNPAEDVQLPRARRRDTDERIISRPELRGSLLPVVPERYRAVVALAAAAGLRWGEVVGLRADALDVEAGRVHVLRTVIEVNGNTAFKPFPKSAAGRRSIPLPGWVLPVVRDHLELWPMPVSAPVFANEVGAPLRRSLFRTRVWRPSLVRAGLLGAVESAGEREHIARWVDGNDQKQEAILRTYAQAVAAVDQPLDRPELRRLARVSSEGSGSTTSGTPTPRGSSTTGVPPNMVQRVLGHERATTTLDLHTRRTDDSDRILRALDDPAGEDPDDEPPGAPVPV